MGEHTCKICQKNVEIGVQFKEFDMARQSIIVGMTDIVKKLNDIIMLL